MVDNDSREKWDEAHRLAIKHERIFFELPDGADKDEVALIVWIVRLVHNYKNMKALTRLFLVQLPFAAAAVAALYGAGSGVLEFIIWWKYQ